MFSDAESDGVLAGTITGTSKQLSQQVVFWRDHPSSQTIRFSTVFGGLGVAEIRIKKSGSTLATLTHNLTADADFGGLLDQMLARMKSLSMPPVPPWTMLPEINGLDDDPESPIPLSMSACALGMAPAATALSSSELTGWARNLLTKLSIAADHALNGGDVALKIGGGYLKGYIDGLWEGLKSDVTGITDLAVLRYESVIKSDHTRSKALWDGIQQLAALDKEGRSQLFDAMMEKFIDKAQINIPWRYSAESGYDWGIAAYMSGYSGGFVIWVAPSEHS